VPKRYLIMKIYILADMEGISGIRTADQVKSDSPSFRQSCKLMMSDINEAVDAAFNGGAEEVVVCDMHAGGGQLKIEEMDSRAIYECPNCGRLMPSLDKSFNGIMLVGIHAKAGTLNGFLDHTINSMSWFEYRINGQIMGEIGIAAAYGGHYDVPVIMVSGDYATTKEAEELLGDVECAAVKWGIGRNSCKCLSIPKAHERIRTAVLKGLNSIDTFKSFRPSLPAIIQLTLYRSDMADDLASRPGVNRIGARTIERRVTSFLDVCLW
jgi:D-amino peptidase